MIYNFDFLKYVLDCMFYANDKQHAINCFGGILFVIFLSTWVDVNLMIER